MSKQVTHFGQFAIGDYIVFERRFRKEDFEGFSELSGDRNPLHHDVAYSEAAGFDAPVVPLHITAAPLSAIAGMMLPGDPSLYLGHELRALKPVYYDDTLTYSARITAISDAARILQVKVLALRGSAVVLEAILRIQVREESWKPSTTVEIGTNEDAMTALVTGASGEIGAALARRLAQGGWNLLLTYGSDDQAAEALALECQDLGATVNCLRADLSDGTDLGALEAAVAEYRPSTLIHAASPPLAADIAPLIAVNYQALNRLSETMLPGMLQRQRGCIVMIGSSAMEYFPEGWNNYVAAKSMAVSLVAGLERRYGAYGVHGITIAPGFVKTRFSLAYRKGDAAALLPEEVADTVFGCVETPDATAPYISLEIGIRREGAYGFHRTTAAATTSSSSAAAAIAAIVPGPETSAAAPHDSEGLAALIRAFLGLTANTDMTTAGMGITEGWDSLKHIEILLHIERTYGISFSAHEIDETTRYDKLEHLWLDKTTNQK